VVNTVGFRNYKFFVLFLFWTVIMCFFLVVTIGFWFFQVGSEVVFGDARGG